MKNYRKRIFTGIFTGISLLIRMGIFFFFWREGNLNVYALLQRKENRQISLFPGNDEEISKYSFEVCILAALYSVISLFFCDK